MRATIGRKPCLVGVSLFTKTTYHAISLHITQGSKNLQVHHQYCIFSVFSRVYYFIKHIKNVFRVWYSDQNNRLLKMAAGHKVFV